MPEALQSVTRRSLTCPLLFAFARVIAQELAKHRALCRVHIVVCQSVLETLELRSGVAYLHVAEHKVHAVAFQSCIGKHQLVQPGTRRVSEVHRCCKSHVRARMTWGGPTRSRNHPPPRRMSVARRWWRRNDSKNVNICESTGSHLPPALTNCNHSPRVW